jgi:Domain of unknown function (DUF397)
MTADDLDLSRAEWRTSTHSNNGGQCIEVAAVWRTSSHSNNGGNCVEVARGGPCVIAIRDSKDPAGPKLAFTAAQWKAFTRAVKG